MTCIFPCKHRRPSTKGQRLRHPRLTNDVPRSPLGQPLAYDWGASTARRPTSRQEVWPSRWWQSGWGASHHHRQGGRASVSGVPVKVRDPVDLVTAWGLAPCRTRSAAAPPARAASPRSTRVANPRRHRPALWQPPTRRTTVHRWPIALPRLERAGQARAAQAPSPPVAPPPLPTRWRMMARNRLPTTTTSTVNGGGWCHLRRDPTRPARGAHQPRKGPASAPARARPTPRRFGGSLLGDPHAVTKPFRSRIYS